ncbi:MAG: translocation/assembly module TamB, partial [Muribaculaceae bacterium]|nr:translocation/assembly module TamB [Muribaculaceae bacterium]
GVYIMSPTMLSLEGLSLEMPASRLAFSNISFEHDEDTSLLTSILDTPFSLTLDAGSHITPADLAPLVPALAPIDRPAELEFEIEGTVNGDLSVRLDAYDSDDRYNLALMSTLSRPLDTISRRIDELMLAASATPKFLHTLLDPLVTLPKGIDEVGYITLDIDGRCDNHHGELDGTLTTDAGMAQFTFAADDILTSSPDANFEIVLNEVAIGRVIANPEIGTLTMRAEGHIRPTKRLPVGEVTLMIDSVTWRQRLIADLSAVGSIAPGGEYSVEIGCSDPDADFNVTVGGHIGSGEKTLNLSAEVASLSLRLLSQKADASVISLKTDASLSGSTVDDIAGGVSLTEIVITDPSGKKITPGDITLTATGGSDDPARQLTFRSDLIDADIRGRYYISTIAGQVRELALKSFPALATAPRRARGPQPDNDFEFDIRVSDTDGLTKRFGLKPLPVSILGEMDVRGSLRYKLGDMSLAVDLPYLRQGMKLIDSTHVALSVDGATGSTTISATSDLPTANGYMRMDLSAGALDDSLATNLRWNIKRPEKYNGDISLNATLLREADGLGAQIRLLPGEATFNDSTWIVAPSAIDISGSRIRIADMDFHRAGQFIRISGAASADTLDVIDIDVLNINLGDIFEALSLTKVLVGGEATGQFHASSLFSPEPRLETTGINVRNVSYNRVVLGDAVARSHWDGDRRAVTLDVDIAPHDGGKHSLLTGALYPMTDSLDLTIRANRVNVAFMQPYMKAFTSDVSGLGTGEVHLFGSFKDVDMEGEVDAEDLRLKIDFTNTYYTVTDRIRMRPGEIRINKATVRDDRGHTAKLAGVVKHKFFGEPTFDFFITDVSGLLVYDHAPSTDLNWYGRVFADGSAHIRGIPGVVDIDVNVRTAAGSTFTYVNNDMKVASNYDFITFRDRDIAALGEQEILAMSEPESVRQLRGRQQTGADEQHDDYNITLQVEITPKAQINMIMDSNGTDSIRSNGTGNIRIGYQSRTDNLNMVGKYVLEKGMYNFTLQDIIIKDFTIREGSRIEFNGDPYKAQLDITTALTINANLSDLDESFLQDRELNRTKVPVNAMVMVRGPLQEPEITYDIDFPTLNEDTKRKINSIINTDEMKSTQIIYLLALERFYTPDYMGSTSNGSELMSVASSTISSQLRNILGHLADNWNIAPSIRSDKGDFSDVEVEVGLSSSLLNNRLLFNGNFGYRDKSLNSNRFVGDFDIEYLLNPAGTWRLKAYNRFNDQNLYLRSAETTQGVGIVFRRTFDDLKSLLGIKRRDDSRTEDDAAEATSDAENTPDAETASASGADPEAGEADQD